MTHEVYVSDAGTQALLTRLAEAEETLRAIRNGEVDGLVINGPEGERVFTLKGAEHPYRIMVETMEEGAATLSAGAILYCNRRFAALLRTPYAQVLGAKITRFLAPESQPPFTGLVTACRQGSAHGEVDFLTPDGTLVPVALACGAFPVSESDHCCLVVTDLSARKAAEATIRQQNGEARAPGTAAHGGVGTRECRVRESEARLRMVVEHSPDLLFSPG